MKHNRKEKANTTSGSGGTEQMTWQSLDQNNKGMWCRWRVAEKLSWGEWVEKHWEQSWANEGDAVQVWRETLEKRQKTPQNTHIRRENQQFSFY